MLLLIYCTCAVLMRQPFLLGGGVTSRSLLEDLGWMFAYGKNAGLSPSGVTEQCRLHECLGWS